MKLAIVILNYRTPDLVAQCLASLEKEIEPITDTVLVVDNCSPDDSLSKIQYTIETNNWGSWVKLIASPVNGGFSAGNNVGIKAITADLYLLLNSDTIVRPGALASLKQAAASHPEAGLIGPRLEWSDGEPQISAFRYHSPLSQIIDAAATGPITKLLEKYDVPITLPDQPMEAQWVSFACVLVRKEVIEQVGLMDEGYFMYFEDVDYCRLATQAGWKILHWPSAHVVHLRGGSGEVRSNIVARKRPARYFYASRARYFAKFYGVLGLWLANICWLIGRSISLTRELLTKKARHTCEYQGQDIWTDWLNPLQGKTAVKTLTDNKLTPNAS